MVSCLCELYKHWEVVELKKRKDEDDYIEYAVELITAVGPKLDSDRLDKNTSSLWGLVIDGIVQLGKTLGKTEGSDEELITVRVRFLIREMAKLRASGWKKDQSVSGGATGPKKLEELDREAEEEERQNLQKRREVGDSITISALHILASTTNPISVRAEDPRRVWLRSHYLLQPKPGPELNPTTASGCCWTLQQQAFHHPWHLHLRPPLQGGPAGSSPAQEARHRATRGEVVGGAEAEGSACLHPGGREGDWRRG